MSASSSDVKTEQIDLAKLSLEQLMQIRQEMEKVRPRQWKYLIYNF